MKLSVVIITQAGGVAAPVGGQVFSEILPYLEVSQGNQEEIEPVEKVQTPDVLGLTIAEAEKILRENGLEIYMESGIEELEKENTVVREQTPQAGIEINKGSKVVLK